MKGTATIRLPEQQLFTLFISKRGELRQLTSKKQGEWICPRHSGEHHSLFTHTNSPIQCSFCPTSLNTSATVYPIMSSYLSCCLPNNVFVPLSTNAHSPLVGLNNTVLNQSPVIQCCLRQICIAPTLFHKM